MWAQPITVAFEQDDLSLFGVSPTSASTTTTTPSSSVPANTSPSSAPTTSPSHSQTPSSGPSTGAIAGIVVGAAALLALIIGASIFFRRKRRPSSRQSELVELHNAQDGYLRDNKQDHAPQDPSWDMAAHKASAELRGDVVIELPNYPSSRRHELP
jgi:LPXTG-motif cell wall-anchored protein